MILTNSYKTLTIVEKEIAEACLGAKISGYEFDKFLFLIDGLIAKTHINCGFPHDLEAVNSSIDELCRDLQKYNGTLSFQEIEIAFKNGWKKQYGEFFGLNNKTYFQWVNGYTWNINRTNAKKAIENAKKKPVMKPKISDQEKEKIIVDGILQAYENFKNGGFIIDAGNVKYNYLEKTGLIKLSVEHKKQILNKVTAAIRLQTLENKKRTKTIELALKEAMTEDILKSEAKKEALREYFEACKEMEIDLETELTTLKTNINL